MPPRTPGSFCAKASHVSAQAIKAVPNSSMSFEVIRSLPSYDRPDRCSQPAMCTLVARVPLGIIRSDEAHPPIVRGGEGHSTTGHASLFPGSADFNDPREEPCGN